MELPEVGTATGGTRRTDLPETASALQSGLLIHKVTAGYRSQPIIFDVTVAAQAGTVTTIIGPNGAGKSTLFKALFGLARLFTGSVLVNGKPTTNSTRALVKSGVAYVPQSRNVFPSLSVRENLEIGAYVRGRLTFDRVFALFPDLASVLSKSAGKLSGGQRNMLAVARALMSDPEIVLLDEATGGLSPMLARKLWEHVAELAATGVAIIAVEQNVRMALDYSQWVYVLSAGRNLLDGSPLELSKLPNFASMFLGSDAHSEGAVQ